MNTNQDVSFLKKVLIITAVASLAIILLVLLWHLAHMLLVIFAGILLAVFLDGLSDWTGEKLRLPHGASLTLVIVILAAFITATGYLLGPRLFDQFGQLAERIPEAIDSIRNELAKQESLKKLMADWSSGKDILSAGSAVLGRITGLFSTVFGIILTALIILFVGVYLAVAPGTYRRNLLLLVPRGYRDTADELLAAWTKALRWWLAGRFASMFIVGVLTALGVWIVGIPLALTLGFIAAVLSFIPILGPVLTVVPLVLVALAEAPILALWALVIYSVVQFMESYFITPLIQQQAVFIPPAVLIAAQTVLGVLFGLLGIFLATPLAVVVIVTVQILYVRKGLGEDVRIMGVHTPRSDT